MACYIGIITVLLSKIPPVGGGISGNTCRLPRRRVACPSQITEAGTTIALTKGRVACQSDKCKWKKKEKGEEKRRMRRREGDLRCYGMAKFAPSPRDVLWDRHLNC